MPSQRSTDVAPSLTGPAYGVAALFVLLPILDTLAQVWPPGVGSPSWRYGTIGLGANYLVSLVFGLWLACLIASLRLHRRTLLTLSIVCWVLAVLALVATLAFVLDALELRPGLPRDNARNLWFFDVGAAKAAFKYVVSAVVLGWTALLAWRAGRIMPRAADLPRLVREQKVKA